MSVKLDIDRDLVSASQFVTQINAPMAKLNAVSMLSATTCAKITSAYAMMGTQAMVKRVAIVTSVSVVFIRVESIKSVSINAAALVASVMKVMLLTQTAFVSLNVTLTSVIWVRIIAMVVLIVAINVKVLSAVANRVGMEMALTCVVMKTNAILTMATVDRIPCVLTSVIHIAVSVKLALQ